MKVSNTLIAKIDCFSSFDEAVNQYKFSHGLFVSSNAESLFNNELTHIIMSNDNIHCYPDGVGATVALKSRLKKKSVKIPGCELWLAILKNRCETGPCKIALLGATQEVVSEVSVKISALYKNAEIVYTRNGYDIDKVIVVADILRLKPDLVFIATGQPSQELLGIDMIANNLSISVFGVGGSFDLFVGKVNRAPKLMVKLKLEWLYRLYLQPYRAKRIFTALFNVIKIVVTK